MHFIHLGMVASYDANAGADRGAIALGADQLDLDPVLLVAAVVAQQRRHIVHVQNERVDVAIVVVVAESGAAAGEAFADARSHRRGHVFELAIAQVLVDAGADS